MSRRTWEQEAGGPRDLEDEAGDAFARRHAGRWTGADQDALEMRAAGDPAYADALGRVERSWKIAGRHATCPEMMMLREQALTRMRRARSGTARWRAAAAVAVFLGAALVAFTLSPWGYPPGLYRTSMGEQRTIELEDRSRIVMDSRTRLRVRFSGDARTIKLLEGQAQFTVARDPRRAFKVEAGGHEIIALGTVFTVEALDRDVNVTLLEGRVAVVAPPAAGVKHPPAESGIELKAGEALRLRRDGKVTVIPEVDLSSALAWRQGKTVFLDEPLGEAIRRLNRHSRTQIAIDDAALSALRVSGVFDTGDAEAFARAIEAYLPLTVERSADGSLRLTARPD